MNWSNLTQSQKADLMRIYLDNGISSLDQMQDHYNGFKKGGPINPPSKEDFLRDHYNKWLKVLKDNGIQDAERFAVYLTKQDALESSYGSNKAALKKNNFGGMQRSGRDISYKNVSDYMRNKLEMLQTKMPNSFKATNIVDWASSLNDKHSGFIYAEDPEYSKKLRNMGEVDDVLGIPYTESFQLPTVKITASSPYNLTDYQRAIIKRYYSNPDGSYTEKGKEYAKEMSYYNTTGQSQFMKDVNRLSPTNALHEGISTSRNFIQKTPGLEFLYDAVSTGLTFSPLAPVGIAMQGLDAIGGLNDMLDNGVTYENVTDILGVLPVKVKGTKTLGKVLNPHTGKVTYSNTQIPKQLMLDIPIGVNELLINDMMLHSTQTQDNPINLNEK